jgi:hypothetical protein
VNLTRISTHWKLRTRKLELGRRTLVMGVVNITPDSFSDGGNFLDPQAAIAHGLQREEQTKRRLARQKSRRGCCP